MKPLIIILLVFLSGLLLSSTCNRKNHHYIRILNVSDKAIYYQVSFNYPDTTLTEETAPNKGNKITSNELGYFNAGSDAFEVNETLQFFIFDAHIIENIDWDTIETNYLILKRYVVTENDMKKLNWQITYP